MLAFDVSRPGDPRFVRAFGRRGTGAGELDVAFDIEVSPAGDRVYVLDVHDRVSVFEPDGTFAHAFGWDVNRSDGIGSRLEVCTRATGCRPGRPGAAAGQLDRAEGLGVDRAGLVHVSEHYNHRVSVFDPRGPAPSFVRAFGVDVIPGGGRGVEVCTVATRCKAGSERAAFGGAAGGLDFPGSIAVDDAGVVAVLERHRVSRFGPGGFLDAFGRDVVPGGGDGFEVCTTATRCQYPAEGSGIGELTAPVGVTVDCRGALWVADLLTSRIDRFGEPGTPLPPCSAAGGGGALPPPDVTRPVLSRVTVMRRGPGLRFALSEPATVVIGVERRTRRRRFADMGTIRLRDLRPGAGSVRFGGRIGERRLVPGRYFATLTAVDRAGNESRPRRLAFRVARR